MACEMHSQVANRPDCPWVVTHRGQRRRRLVALTFFQTLLQVCASDDRVSCPKHIVNSARHACIQVISSTLNSLVHLCRQ